MPFNYSASITDTNDAIPAAITAAVNSKVASLETEISGLETEVTNLKSRVSALESGSTPTPTPTDAFVASKTVLSLGNATTPKSVAKPSNVQAGDLLLMIVSADWGLGTQIGPSTGFTQLTELDLGSNLAKINVAYKVASSSEPASYNVDVTTDTDARVDLLAIRGAKTSGPFPISKIGSFNDTNVGSAWTPEVTPATSRGLFIGSVAVSKSQVAAYSFSFTSPSGMTELSDTSTDGWIGMSTASTTYNSTSPVSRREFGITTNAPEVEKVLISVVIPSAE